MNTNDVLQHFGIPGMRWGRRKGTSTGGSDSKTRSQQRKELKEIVRRNKILSSPKKLLKNLDKFSKEEVDTAVKRMKLNRDLRKLHMDEIKKGSDYINAYLAIGTTAAAVYGLYKSPFGQKITEAIKKASKG